MENALLIGLSRQTRSSGILMSSRTISRTSIPTASRPTRSLFEEYLNSGAHEDNFKPADRRVSYVQDRGTFRDFTQGAWSRPTIRSTSPSAATASSRCRPRAASATPATAICSSTITGQLVTLRRTRCSAPPARSCSSRPTTTSTSPRTAPSRCWKARPHGFDPRQASRRQLRRCAEAAQAGQQPLRRRRARRSRTSSRPSSRASSRSRTSIRWSR